AGCRLEQLALTVNERSDGEKATAGLPLHVPWPFVISRDQANQAIRALPKWSHDFHRCDYVALRAAIDAEGLCGRGWHWFTWSTLSAELAGGKSDRGQRQNRGERFCL